MPARRSAQPKETWVAEQDSGTDNGADSGSLDPEHRSYQRMSTRGPALIVLGIAVVILVGGVVASALDTSTNPTLTLRSVRIQDGTVVQLEPASAALKSIIGSEPPSDILASLAVPAGSTQRSFLNKDQNLSQYDRSVTFASGLSSDQLTSFFRTLLPKLGWKVNAVAADRAAPAGTIEVLATKGSQDGYYWEVGSVISPGTAAGVTTFTVNPYELPDQD